MNQIIKNKNTAFLIFDVFLSLLSLWGYHYNIVIFTILAPFAVTFFQGLKKDSSDDLDYKLFFIFILWLVLNSILIGFQKPIVTSTQIGLIPTYVNVFLISWVNILLYSYFFYNIYLKYYNNAKKQYTKTNMKKIVWATLIISIFSTICFWEKQFLEYLPQLFLMALGVTALYCILFIICFSKKFSIYVNFLISLAPVVTVLSAIICYFSGLTQIIFHIINFFSGAQKHFYLKETMKPAFLYSLYFLIFFQATSISSILFYFTPPQKFKNKKGGVLLFLLVFLTIGFFIQFHWNKFLKF